KNALGAPPVAPNMPGKQPNGQRAATESFHVYCGGVPVALGGTGTPPVKRFVPPTPSTWGISGGSADGATEPSVIAAQLAPKSPAEATSVMLFAEASCAEATSSCTFGLLAPPGIKRSGSSKLIETTLPSLFFTANDTALDRSEPKFVRATTSMILAEG